jgi:hypothetical protein
MALPARQPAGLHAIMQCKSFQVEAGLISGPQKKEHPVTQNKDPQQIMQEFRVRQSRQFVAIAIALFLVLLCAVIYRRPDLFGEFSKGTLFGVQVVIIGSYIGYTSYNWSCPSCGKHLGADINRKICKKCGARLQ